MHTITLNHMPNMLKMALNVFGLIILNYKLLYKLRKLYKQNLTKNVILCISEYYLCCVTFLLLKSCQILNI